MGRPLRICYVMPDLSNVGGAQRQLWQLLANLDRSEFQPTIVNLDRDLTADHFRGLDVPIRSIDYRGTMDASKVLQIRRILVSEKPDIVHCLLTSGNFYGLLASATVGVRGRIAGERSFGSRRTGARRFVYPAVLRLADVIVTNSARNGQWIRDAYRISEKRVRVIANGCFVPPPIDRAAALQIRQQFGIAPDQVFIASVSKLTPEKDVETLIRAMRRLAAAELPAKVVVVGGGPLLEPVQAMIRDLGLQGRVELAGFLDHAQALAITQAADLFVLPSRFEGMPNAVMEAMAYGKACIATNVGGTPELITPDVTGLLVEVGDDENLAAGIMRLARDSELRGTLGRNALRRIASEFSVESMVGRHGALYRSLGDTSARPVTNLTDAPTSTSTR